MVVPNTAPVVHQKSGVLYVIQQSTNLPVTLHPIGAVSKNAEGKELAEMYDMYHSGAVAFGDGTSPLQSSGILLKALQYVKAIDKIIIQLPDDHSISAGGLMNEGIASTRLGLPGKPAIAEELMIRRDIELAKYTGSKLHITGVSSAKGIECIRKAKEDGIGVTCSVTPAHLYFSDEDLAGYDTNLKLLTPLRTKADRQALREAVLDGTVDCIASHHIPHHTDNKVVEFEYARPGMISLETAFSVVRTSLPSLSLEQLISLFSRAPREIFGLQPVAVSKGNAASLSLFFPHEQWIPDTVFSRSKNSPFIGLQLTGFPVGIINRDKVILRSL
jgi:dihydroorotase